MTMSSEMLEESFGNMERFVFMEDGNWNRDWDRKGFVMRHMM
jgi:hypothetical protein